jgi:hypothetical protein
VPAHQAEAVSPYLARQSPLAVYMFRSTRATLRAYQERGLFQGLPSRDPDDVPVAFRTETERTLYHRIDELCSRFYRLAEFPPDERSGVGFLMAVFRKRLASSFAAFQKSLERRRDLIAPSSTTSPISTSACENRRERLRKMKRRMTRRMSGLSSTESGNACCDDTVILTDEMIWSGSNSTSKSTSLRSPRSLWTANSRPSRTAYIG